MGAFKRVVRSVSEKGLTRTVQSIVSVFEDYWFEKKNGIDTSRNVFKRELDYENEHSFWYQPTRVRHFNKVMKTLNIPRDGVFVDLGSGKGRVLLMASQHNFKRVVGIEISNMLCKIARNNVAAFERRAKSPSKIMVRNIDALQYDLNDDESVFYLHRSFDDSILGEVINRIKNSLNRSPRRVWFIFNNFQYGDLFERERLFRRMVEIKYGGAEYTVYVNSAS